jgi:hypothetical protein
MVTQVEDNIFIFASSFFEGIESMIDSDPNISHWSILESPGGLLKSDSTGRESPISIEVLFAEVCYMNAVCVLLLSLLL